MNLKEENEALRKEITALRDFIRSDIAREETNILFAKSLLSKTQLLTS